jgi:hypothetical protein
VNNYTKNKKGAVKVAACFRGKGNEEQKNSREADYQKLSA